MKKAVVFRRKLLLFLTIKYGLELLAIYAFVVGGIYLSAKLLTAASFAPYWALWGLPFIFAAAFGAAWHKVPDASCIMALLDKHGRCGGMVMAAQEIPLGSWQNQLGDIPIPTLQMEAKGSMILLGAALVFAAICILMPIKKLLPAAQPVNVTSELEDIKEKIELLKDDGLIAEAKLVELNQKFDAAKQSAGETDIVKTWEAMDNLKQEITDIAQAAAAKAIADITQMNETKDLAESLHDSNGLRSEGLTQAMSRLSKNMQQLSAANKELKSDDGSLENALSNNSLTPEQLKKLSETLSKCTDKKSKSMAKLGKKGMLNSDTLKMCDKASQTQSDALKALREGKSCAGQGNSSCNLPGRGGVSRGRGDAMLTFGDESSQQNTAFKEKILEPAALGGLDQSQLIGETATAPTLNNDVPSAGSNSAATGNTALGANKYELLPKHRSAVKKYFERNVTNR